MTDSTKPTGVYAAALTPMTADLAPDLERVVAHNRWLLANGYDRCSQDIEDTGLRRGDAQGDADVFG